MSNSPQENLTSPSDADSDLNLTAGGPTPERLVEDVLRDARSLLGEPVAAATHPEQDVEAASEAAVDEMMDRAGADADPSTNESGSDAGMQAGVVEGAGLRSSPCTSVVAPMICCRFSKSKRGA
ncbi:MAG: hypothetical protein CMJ54_06425, partial [Planctomycetaceae bacterium]|nr:hypothetical protein [Planctomycetaceae bacterium]